MMYDPDRHHRKSNRLKGYDYSRPGKYYVTICTQGRIDRFGTVTNGKMILNHVGKMIDQEWNAIAERFQHVVLDTHQIMPNHIHIILIIYSSEKIMKRFSAHGVVGTGLARPERSRRVPVLENDGKKTIENNCLDQSPSLRTPIKDVPTLGSIIGVFKSITTNKYAENVRMNGWVPFEKRLWQLKLHDRVIRGHKDLQKYKKYIRENPQNWGTDEHNLSSIEKELHHELS